MSDEANQPQSEIILCQTEDGRTRIQCQFENETLWLTQSQIAELFETTPQNVTLHLKGIFAEGELIETATCKDYLQVRLEGGREVSRKLRHYRLEAIVAVGFRVRSHRGTQFRQWAIGRLGEYLLKGFTMDDERLKNPPGKGQKDYFDEQLDRIRDIRSSERRFYQKILDVNMRGTGRYWMRNRSGSMRSLKKPQRNLRICRAPRNPSHRNHDYSPTNQPKKEQNHENKKQAEPHRQRAGAGRRINPPTKQTHRKNKTHET